MRHPIDLTAPRTGAVAERAFVWVCRLGAAIPLAMLAWLLLRVAIDGAGRLSWSFVTEPPSQLDAAAAGIAPALAGTLWLVVLTALFALPIGVGAAIYLEEYDRKSRAERHDRAGDLEPGRRAVDRLRHARPRPVRPHHAARRDRAGRGR
jgi:ABC-type phosphate transport system permease subunit